MQAQTLFDQTSSMKVDAKVSYDIVVFNPRGWLQIISQWWAIEGESMTTEELGKKLSFMLTACQKYYNKTEEKIISPYIQYKQHVKAK